MSDIKIFLNSGRKNIRNFDLKCSKSLFNSVGTQQIFYYQSINLATCFGSLSRHQTNSQTILKVHSVDVHSVGSQMFTDRMTVKCRSDSLVATRLSLIHYTYNRMTMKCISVNLVAAKLSLIHYTIV